MIRKLILVVLTVAAMATLTCWIVSYLHPIREPHAPVLDSALVVLTNVGTAHLQAQSYLMGGVVGVARHRLVESPSILRVESLEFGRVRFRKTIHSIVRPYRSLAHEEKDPWPKNATQEEIDRAEILLTQSVLCTHAQLPLWIPFMLLAVYPAVTLVCRQVRRLARSRGGLCIKCGFAPDEHEAGQCPRIEVVPRRGWQKIRSMVIVTLTMAGLGIGVIGLESNRTSLRWGSLQIERPSSIKNWPSPSERQSSTRLYAYSGGLELRHENTVPRPFPTFGKHNWGFSGFGLTREVYGWDPTGSRSRRNHTYMCWSRFEIKMRFWILVIVLLAYPMIAFMRGPLRRWRRWRRGLCLTCGYDLQGNESGTCPECGVEDRRA